MLLMRFSSRQIELLKEMKKKCVTAREQSTYSPFAFYMNIGMLKRYGLVCENGFDNGRKTWRLTKKGEQFIMLVENAENLLEEKGGS